jgi:drug/metabolite transporter (DMT)-like permease
LDVEVWFGKRTFTRNLYFITVFTAFAYVIWNALMVWGTCNTVQSHAFALSNLHGILIIPIMVAMKREVHKLEKFGCLIIGVACVGLTLDNWSLRADQLVSVPSKKYYKHVSSASTDLLMLVSNVPAILYFALNRSLMRNRFMTHLLLLNFLIMIIFTILAVLVEDAQFDLSPKKGLFGWLDGQQAFTAIFWYGFFATFWGSIGYVLAMQFYSPLIVMNAYLMEPLIAQVLGYIFGIDLMPGMVTILGVILIFGGTLLVNKGTKIMIKENKRNNDEPEGGLDEATKDKDEAKLRELEAKVNAMKMQSENLQKSVHSKE